MLKVWLELMLSNLEFIGVYQVYSNCVIGGRRKNTVEYIFL